MALIACSECNKQISDKAAACPHCGAPVSRSSAPSPELQPERPMATAAVPLVKKGTHPATWIALVMIVVAGVWFFMNAQREAGLPSMPVEVQSRPAMTGPGRVLMVRNTSTRHLSFMVSMMNPTTNQEKSYRLDIGPSRTAEVGYKEGWTLAAGDHLKITNSEYQSWAGGIP